MYDKAPQEFKDCVECLDYYTWVCAAHSEPFEQYMSCLCCCKQQINCMYSKPPVAQAVLSHEQQAVAVSSTDAMIVCPAALQWSITAALIVVLSSAIYVLKYYFCNWQCQIVNTCMVNTCVFVKQLCVVGHWLGIAGFYFSTDL